MCVLCCTYYLPQSYLFTYLPFYLWLRYLVSNAHQLSLNGRIFFPHSSPILSVQRFWRPTRAHLSIATKKWSGTFPKDIKAGHTKSHPFFTRDTKHTRQRNTRRPKPHKEEPNKSCLGIDLNFSIMRWGSYVPTIPTYKTNSSGKSCLPRSFFSEDDTNSWHDMINLFHSNLERKKGIEFLH